MKKCYYAHSVALYNTAQESRDVETLKSIGFEVINPNQNIHSKRYKQYGMDYFNTVIEKCDVLAFRSYYNTDIPAGVAKEVNFANKRKIPVIELPSAVLKRSISIEHTREYLQEVGAR